MIIRVRVTANAKKNEIIEDRDSLHRGSYFAKVKAPAQGGKANIELIGMLAEHFDVPKNSIKIIRGAKSREKTIDIS